jgi:hypothetical protein
MEKPKDTIVEELHALRAARAEQYGYDTRAMFDALRLEQKRSGRKVVSFAPKKAPAPKTE